MQCERSGAESYFKNKYETIKKALQKLLKFEETCNKFKRENYEKMQKDIEAGGYKDIDGKWKVDKRGDVLQHYPP
jgi:hypothetical protein